MQAFEANKISDGTKMSVGSHEATSQLVQVLKAFIVWFSTDSEDPDVLARHQFQIDILQAILTELLGLVRSGSIDSRHSSDILKLIKRDMFGDYSF